MIDRIPYNIKFSNSAGMRIWAKVWKEMRTDERRVFLKYYKGVLKKLREEYYIDGEVRV